MQEPVQISNMKRQTLHERTDIFPTHRDDYLFSGWTFGCHLDMWFWFDLAIDNVIYLINLLSIEGREHIFDFQNIRRFVGHFSCLSVRFARIVGIAIDVIFDHRFVG